MKVVKVVAWILLLIGGINWGILGVSDFNLVAAIFQNAVVIDIVYVLVGLSAIMFAFKKCDSHKCDVKAAPAAPEAPSQPQM